MRTRNHYLLSSLIVAVSLIVALATVRACTDESAVTAPKTLGLRTVSYKGWHRSVVADVKETPQTTTEVAATEVTATSSRTRPEPLPRESEPTAGGDDSAAWACLAVLESGNGSASPNIYGILDSRVAGMSRYAQLAYARRIRDNYGGSYAVGWPETSKECGLS